MSTDNAEQLIVNRALNPPLSARLQFNKYAQFPFANLKRQHGKHFVSEQKICPQKRSFVIELLSRFCFPQLSATFNLA